MLRHGLRRMSTRPQFISFDAFDTLYTPRDPIAIQYHRIGQEFGYDILVALIEKDFPVKFKKLLNKYPNYGKYSKDIRSCDEWWLTLIVDVFNISHFLKDIQSEAFCKRLLYHFTTPDAYRVFDDVVPTLYKLKDMNIPMIVSSNSDSRTVQVLENLGLSKYFNHIYLSYDLGSSKPSQGFYDSILKRENVVSGEDCWHVGDELVKDYKAARNAGWNSVLLNRDSSVHVENIASISNLNDLLKIFA